MADGWYLIDFARSRHTNPARIPVSPLGCRYHMVKLLSSIAPSTMALFWLR
jgi:hypothetical protein